MSPSRWGSRCNLHRGDTASRCRRRRCTWAAPSNACQRLSRRSDTCSDSCGTGFRCMTGSRVRTSRRGTSCRRWGRSTRCSRCRVPATCFPVRTDRTCSAQGLSSQLRVSRSSPAPRPRRLRTAPTSDTGMVRRCTCRRSSPTRSPLPPGSTATAWPRLHRHAGDWRRTRTAASTHSKHSRGADRTRTPPRCAWRHIGLGTCRLWNSTHTFASAGRTSR